EWKHPQRGTGAAFDRLSRGGHEVCVFVLTAAASEKHRGQARASYETWGSRKPPGVQVFFVKDFSWTAEDMTGRPHDENPENVLSLRGDVDLGFLYNPVRAFYLWLYLAEHHASDCAWFVKVDGDTFVNLWALKLRLQRYFNS
ncbi:YUC10, partial [Symbiodinium sp. CCMP2456]